MKIWKYTTIFFAAAFATLLMVFLTQKPQTVINAENYIAEQKQEIKKLKQKGEGNNAELNSTIQTGDNQSDDEKKPFFKRIFKPKK